MTKEELEELRKKQQNKIIKNISIAAIVIVILILIEICPLILTMIFADESSKLNILSTMLRFSIPEIIILAALAGIVIYINTADERNTYRELKKLQDSNNKLLQKPKNTMTLEEIRIRLKKRAIIGNIVTIITVIVLLVIIFFLFRMEDIEKSIVFIFWCICGLVAIAIYRVLYGKDIKTGMGTKFNTALKEKYVIKPLEKVCTDIEFYPWLGLYYTEIQNTTMIKLYEKPFDSNDRISGKYKNINFLQGDAAFTVNGMQFIGRWMIFDFNKYFKVKMTMYEKKFENIIKPNIKDYKKIEIENQKFNEKFEIYAQDEHEAFYILTPKIIDAILKTTDNISGEFIFCFVDNKLHIGINNDKDSFEPNIFKELDEEKYSRENEKDIKLITELIDEFDLSNDLFKK